jgi:type I restriction enzyme S subunit
LRQTDIATFPIPWPASRRKIAAVLAAYDELIENNLRRIEILEEMAQAVYREWFVNFRFPGHEDLALVDSPLGPIPEGWSAGAFGDLAENQRVNVNPLKSPDELFDHFSFAAFDEGLLPSTELGETMKSGKLLVERDSVLLAKLNPRIPRVWFTRPGGVRRSVASSEFLVLTSRTGSALELVYAICGDPTFQSRLATMSGGTSTSHQRLKLDDLLRLPIPIAPKDVVEAFVAITRPMYRLVTNLTIQNANLRTTRDLLLPKLVSGDIDVSDLDIDTEWLAS